MWTKLFYASERNNNENKISYLLFILISLLTSFTVKQIQIEKKKERRQALNNYNVSENIALKMLQEGKGE